MKFYQTITMKPKFILCLALALSCGLFGCSTANRQTKIEEISALPLYVHFGTDDTSLVRLLSAQIHIGETFFVGGDGYSELKGRIDRRNANLGADLTGGTGQESQFYRGNIALEKPFFGQGGAFSGGAGLIWFVVSTNSDSRAILERVDASLRLLGFTNAPANQSEAILPPPVISNAPKDVDPATGLPLSHSKQP
jgi:hypothetical protein